MIFFGNFLPLLRLNRRVDDTKFSCNGKNALRKSKCNKCYPNNTPNKMEKYKTELNANNI